MQNKKGYNEIRHLSIEERLNYYKTLYGDDNVLEKKSTANEKKVPLEKGQKPAKIDVSETKKVNDKRPSKNKKAEKVKEKGLFGKLFSKILKK